MANIEQKRFSPFLVGMILVSVTVAVLAYQMLFSDSDTPDTVDLSGYSDPTGTLTQPGVKDRIEGFEEDPPVVAPITDPQLPPAPASELYLGLHAQVIDAYTRKPIPQYTFYYCDAAEGLLTNKLLNAKTRIVRNRRDGVVRITGLKEGEYSIAVKVRGYQLYTETDVKTTRQDSPRIIEVSRGTFIEGQVLCANGTPMQGAPVHLEVKLENPKDDPPALRFAESDREGKFLFGDLPPGTYSLLLRSLDNPLDAVRDIYLARGSRRFETLNMPDLNTLEFLVTNSSNHPIPDAQIRLYSSSGAGDFRAETDRQGRAKCSFVPQGTYNLRIYKQTYKHLIEENFEITTLCDIININRMLDKE